MKDAPPDQPLAELNAAAMAYGRAARAVRLAILLQEQLSQGGGDPQAIARQAEAAREAALAARKTAHIGRAVRIVERVAMTCQIKPSRIGDYAYAARERLDDDDIYSLVATRPLGELVALVCRDLGLKPDWDALAGEAWARAEIASGAAGSPFLKDDDDEEDDQSDEAPPPLAGGRADRIRSASTARRAGGGEDDDGPDPGAARPAFRPPTFEARLRAVPQDPVIIAAARRDSG